ncbi:MAG: Uma2 family endonuclease [Deltaproteobacteria bacterium]|nr:Uma2 family endonuclease [Deltaproteobacteria bacterium]
MKSTLDSNRSLTYADYLDWPEDERWELIEGRAFDMTPAPSPQHQRMLVDLVRQIVD